MTLDHVDAEALSLGWYGYGSWTAPYWFVGMEPGGDQGAANFARWDELGRGELVDIFEHHRGHVLDWFGDASATQSTWAKLIWLLLAYKGADPSREATIAYQRNRLGRRADETALLELSALAAVDNKSDVPRTLNRAHRIETIRQRVSYYRPAFVVFYSTKPEYAGSWASIAGCPLLEGRPVMVGETAFVMTYHPQYKRDRKYWVDIATSLREARALGAPGSAT